MRIIEKKLYTFAELSKEAKQKALEDNRYYFVEDDYWYESIYEYWMEKLEKRGFSDINIKFSGFWSQGDGASFTADVDIKQWLRKHKLANKYRALYNAGSNINASVARINWRYVHERSISASVEFYASDFPELSTKQLDKLDAQAEAVEKLLNANVLELSQKIYADLQEDYEHYTSDEYITEMIKANGFEFYEDGSRY